MTTKNDKLKKLLLVVMGVFMIGFVNAQSGTTGPLNWNISNDTLFISGVGDMPDYDGDLPYYAYKNDINTVIVGNGINNIGNYAFAEFINMTYINIPNSVIKIGQGSFAGSTRIESINIPSSVNNIGKMAFEYCSSLKSIIIPEGVSSIGEGTFQLCVNITSIKIPNSVNNIGESAFYHCTNLTSIVIPANVVNIGDGSFIYCTNLSSITNLNPNPIYIDTNHFIGVDISSCVLKVPIGSVSAYENDDTWGLFIVDGIGTGFVSGYVESDNNQGKVVSQKSTNSPAEDVIVYLEKEKNSDWVTVGKTVTNSEGYFKFADVSAGKYKIVLDIEGLDHTNPQMIEINENDSVKNILYEITEEGINNNTVSVINLDKEEININVYPNPTKGLLHANGQGLQNIEYNIYNVNGQLMMKNKLESTINIEGLSNGIYYLKIGDSVTKVVKQ